MAENRKSPKQLFHEPAMKKHKQFVSENIINQNSGIPEEIQFCILQNVPGKSLVRFKCINKSLHSMISDPNFINKTPKIILCDFKSIFLMNYKVPRAEAMRLDIPTEIKSKVVKARASCNGILWISVNGEDILWNPFTSEHKIMSIVPHMSTLFIERSPAYGLGYDHIRKDYQVIFIPVRPLKPFIYSAARDSCESVEDHIPQYVAMTYYNTSGISIKNGSVVYWLALYSFDREGGTCVFCHNHIVGPQLLLAHPHRLILEYNFVSRRQLLVQQPPYDGYSSTEWKLLDFKGSLGMVKRDTRQGLIEIWLYKEEMDKEKYWVKLMSIEWGGFRFMGLPICIGRDEEILIIREDYIRNRSKAIFFAYNSTEKRLRCVEVDGVKHWYQELNYTQTLASIQS